MITLAKKPTITAMTVADLAAVMVVEEQTPGPWNKKQFSEELTQPTSGQWLAKVNGQVTGFLILRTVVDEGEILKLAVAKGHRRQGIAQQLLDHAFAQLQQEKVAYCFLELRVGNLAARHLYEKNDFCWTGTRKSYYSAPNEDGITMTKKLLTV